MQRREFITLVGGAAVWPLAARAQQNKSMRRIGMLMPLPANDPEGQVRVAAFLQGLQELGWSVGRNVIVDVRWSTDSADIRKYATELIALAPEVILANSSLAVAPLVQMTRTVPIVFTTVADPVGAGYVESLARPGGNITGFTIFEYSISAKWLQLLKEVAPSAVQIAVLFNPRTSPYNTLWMRSIEAAAPGFSASTFQASVQSDEDIRRAFDTLLTKPGTGLVVPSDSFTFERAPLIASLAMDARIPAVYAFPRFAHEGGLISYGIDLVEQLGKAAVYVDRILKGQNPGELPVQADTLHNDHQSQDRQSVRPNYCVWPNCFRDEVIE